MELYQYDFSIYSNDDVRENGYFGNFQDDKYWNTEGRYQYLIRVNGNIAGFILVEACAEYNELPNTYNIQAFLVLQKYRRHGVGKAAAMSVFDKHKGNCWQLSLNELLQKAIWIICTIIFLYL